MTVKILILSLVLSLFPSAALAHPRDANDARHLRYAYLVAVQQAPRHDNLVLVEVDGDEYAVTLTVDGQSASYSSQQGVQIRVEPVRRLIVVSVASFDKPASCRLWSATGRLLSVVRGGTGATCMWVRR